MLTGGPRTRCGFLSRQIAFGSADHQLNFELARRDNVTQRTTKLPQLLPQQKALRGVVSQRVSLHHKQQNEALTPVAMPRHLPPEQKVSRGYVTLLARRSESACSKVCGRPAQWIPPQERDRRETDCQFRTD